MNYHRHIYTISRYTFTEAVNVNLFLILFISLICIFGLTEFMGELAVTETRQIQGSILALLLRLFSVFLIVIYVLTSMSREFNDKTFEFILALPVPRYVYYFGKWFGYLIIAVIIALLTILPLLIYIDIHQVVIWYFSLVCELIIVLTFCLLCVFTFSHITTSFFIVTGFYMLARSMNAIELISNSPILYSNSKSQEFIRMVIDIIAYLLPQLDQFTRTEWLVYNASGIQDISPVIIQTVIYSGILICAALFDLYRKNY